MAVAFEPAGKEFDYVLKADRELPQEKRSIFRLRRLALHEMKKVEQLQHKVRYIVDPETLEKRKEDREVQADLTMTNLEQSCEILQMALVLWNNFKDPDGSDVDFRRDTKGRIPDEVMVRIIPYVDELSDAVLSANTLTEEDAKNS